MKFKSNIEIQAGLEDAGGSPGTVNQLLSSTVTGTAWIDPSTIVAEAATLVVIACKNTSGAAIAQGTPVYQTGTVGATATIEIAPADALISANKLPAIGLLQTALNNNGFGFVVITGELTNFTTSPIDGVVPTTGDKVFVKSGGGLTLTKPTGEGNGIQNMGLVGKVSGGNAGSITVSSIMRTNDVPNLPEGRIWVGDGNTIVSDTVYVDEPNNRVGIGTNNPNSSLEVAGEIDSVGGDGYLVEGIPWARDNSGLLELGDWDGVGYDTSILGANGNLAIRTLGGNVGIGTTSPGAKLEVVGTTGVIIDSGTSTQALLTLKGDASSYGGGGQINIIGGSQDYLYYATNINRSPGTLEAREKYEMYSHTWTWDGNMGSTAAQPYTSYDFKSQGSSQMVIYNNNVGIGTTNPGDKLVVQGDGDGILVRSNDFTLSRIIPRGQTSTNWDKALFSLYNAAAENVRIDTAGSSWFNGGNVGIGTTSPTQKLHVAGRVASTAGNGFQIINSYGSPLLSDFYGNS